MIVLEFIGMFLSIIAVLFISKATNQHIYKANVLFYISNMSLLTFFIVNGIISIAIQMLFFFITSIIGILRLSSNKSRDKKYILISFSLFILFFSIYLFINGLSNISFSIKPLDVIAASLAIIGSFLLAFDNFVKRNAAYILFIIADVLYVYIGYQNTFYFFMIQSFFFIFTSSIGLKNNFKIHKNK